MIDIFQDIWRAQHLGWEWLKWTLRIAFILFALVILGLGLRFAQEADLLSFLRSTATIEVPVTNAPQARAPQDIIWLPGRDRVAVADSTGEVEEIDVDHAVDAAIRVGDDTIIGVESRNPILPDFAPPPVRVTVVRDGLPVLVTPQRRPLVQLSPVLSAGLGLSAGAQTGIIAACPVQLGPIRPCAGGFVRAPSGEDLSIGISATLTTRVFHPRLRLHAGVSDLLRGTPRALVGLTFDLSR